MPVPQTVGGGVHFAVFQTENLSNVPDLGVLQDLIEIRISNVE
jgi:hypothetical protein